MEQVGSFRQVPKHVRARARTHTHTHRCRHTHTLARTVPDEFVLHLELLRRIKIVVDAAESRRLRRSRVDVWVMVCVSACV